MADTLQTTTTFSFDGYRITEYKGLVRGIVVRSPTLGQGFWAALSKSLAGRLAHMLRCVSKPESRLTIFCFNTLETCGRTLSSAFAMRVLKSVGEGRPRKSCATEPP